jgi:UDP-galactopyranose mutase
MPDSWTALFTGLLSGIEVWLETDYLTNRSALDKLAHKVVYTGPIDAYFDYVHGALEWRTLDFITERYEQKYYQPSPLVTYPSLSVPFTRSSEYKHFHPVEKEHTIVIKEYPRSYTASSGISQERARELATSSRASFGIPSQRSFYSPNEPYYPINDEANTRRYRQYREMADLQPGVIIGGRLGNYIYADSHQVINMAFSIVQKELEKNGN